MNAKDAAVATQPRVLECLDCKHRWIGRWALETRCPRCGRGFTLPVPLVAEIERSGEKIACPRCMPPGDPCCPYCDGTYGVKKGAAS